MVTIKQIEKEYGKRIPRKFRVQLEKYIDNDTVQRLLRKALSYKLSESDFKELYIIGSHPDSKKLAMFPGLNYICVTFIHPVTKWQAVAEKLDRLERSLGSC